MPPREHRAGTLFLNQTEPLRKPRQRAGGFEGMGACHIYVTRCVFPSVYSPSTAATAVSGMPAVVDITQIILCQPHATTTV